MELSIHPIGNTLLVRLEEQRLDAAVAISFKEAMRTAAANPGSPVLLDMSKIDFMDSSGLGAIVGVMKLLGPERPLELCGLTGTVAKLFRLTRMDSVFKLHDRVPELNCASHAHRIAG